MTRDIKVQELTRSSYQEIGEYITNPEHQATIEEDIVRYWANLGEFSIQGKIDIGWVTMKKRPLVIREMERHFDTTEIIIPLSDMVVPVAVGRDFGDRNAKPRVSDFKAFYLRPGQMITYHPGAWHFGGFPLNADEASFIVMCRKGTADEDVVMLGFEDADQVQLFIE